MRKHRFVIAGCILAFLAVTLQSCNSIQQILQGTPTPTATLTPTLTATPTLTPTSTPTPTFTPTSTATLDLAATQQYEVFFPLVQEYYAAKYISSTEGTYYRLDDYSDSLAKQGYYHWTTLGMHVRNFVLRSHVKMSTANEMSPSTGCGLAFRAMGSYTDAVYVKQGGSVFYLTNNTIWYKQYYGTFPNPAEFELVVIANETRIRVYVDGKQALVYGTFIGTYAGDLGFTVASGSNENESRCDFTNNELWVVKPE